jgi:hypothetical protein
MQQIEKFNLRASHDFVWKNGNVLIALKSGNILGCFGNRATQAGRRYFANFFCYASN